VTTARYQTPLRHNINQIGNPNLNPSPNPNPNPTNPNPSPNPNPNPNPNPEPEPEPEPEPNPNPNPNPNASHNQASSPTSSATASWAARRSSAWGTYRDCDSEPVPGGALLCLRSKKDKIRWIRLGCLSVCVSVCMIVCSLSYNVVPFNTPNICSPRRFRALGASFAANSF
jgi:hypothetical protein